MEHCHLILDPQEHLFIVLFFPREVFFHPLETVPKPGTYQPVLRLAEHQKRNKNCLELLGRWDGLGTFSVSCGNHTPKLRGMGRLAGLTFASSLCFEEIGFVLGHKNQKKGWRERKGGTSERRKGKEKKKERGKEAEKRKWSSFLLPMKSLSVRPRYLDWPLR